MLRSLTNEQRQLITRHRNDWVSFARNVLRVRLDKDQEAILRSVERCSRTVVRSGHARGKDFTAAVAVLCFLYNNYPSKVILTGPTDRQVKFIMIRQCESIWKKAAVPLGGRFNTNGIFFENEADWFMLGFKAGDKNTEAWTGFHSPNIMVVVTEASGIAQDTYDAVEGILTGNSRLLLVMNPNRTVGEAYNAFKSPIYAKHTLSCLNAPNVQAKKVLIPGQVDWDWVNTLIQKPGWVSKIKKEDATEDGDFEWNGSWYRASDLFRVKVMGLWPNEPSGRLIPLSWIEAAQQRWRAWKEAGAKLPADPLRLGVDVAGMGNDLTSLVWRYGDVVAKLDVMGKSDHMATVGRIGLELTAPGGNSFRKDAKAFIDTIGEGAGVYSRGHELKQPVVSVKFSQSATGYKDLTGQRKFANMRAYCYWAIRDALDPQHKGGLMLPPDDELTEELTAPEWSINSRGEILIEPKDDIKQRLARSPDKADGLALTYFPGDQAGVMQGGALKGLGMF